MSLPRSFFRLVKEFSVAPRGMNEPLLEPFKSAVTFVEATLLRVLAVKLNRWEAFDVFSGGRIMLSIVLSDDQVV